MIVKQNVSWFRLLFTIRGSGLDRTFPRILVITLFSVVITCLAPYTDVEKYALTATPFTLIGLALGIFLGFRNNVAYDRYWEGRKLWGALVNISRTFARQSLTLINPPRGDTDPQPDMNDADTHDSSSEAALVCQLQREVIYRVIAFAHALRASLRDSDSRDDTERLLARPNDEWIQRQQNIPQAILLSNGFALRDAWQRKWIHELHLPVLESSLQEMTAIQGACERIKNTPFPFVYSVLLHQIVAFYCFFLSLGIIAQVGLMTPIVVMLISHAFLGLDEIGDEIEDPFGTQPNHLPLTALCRTIEINLREQLGEIDLPPPLQPIDQVLQ